MTYISFACKLLPIEQLLKCSLGLTRTEMKLLKLLSSDKKEYEVPRLAKAMQKDRTVVQRAANSLHKKGLVKRRQVNLESGGYYFLYSAIPKQVIKEKIYANFKSFNKAVEDAIERW